MADTDKQRTAQRRDEVVKRMLSTPPKPRKPKEPAKPRDRKDLE